MTLSEQTCSILDHIFTYGIEYRKNIAVQFRQLHILSMSTEVGTTFYLNAWYSLIPIFDPYSCCGGSTIYLSQSNREPNKLITKNNLHWNFISIINHRNDFN